MTYYVVEKQNGKTIATISGMGRNRGTLDCGHESRRTAQRHAKAMREKNPSKQYAIETL